jgi:hypothetical protein
MTGLVYCTGSNLSNCHDSETGSLRYFMHQHVIPRLLSTVTGDNNNNAAQSSQNDACDGSRFTNLYTIDYVESSLKVDGIMNSYPIHVVSDNAKSPSSEFCQSSNSKSLGGTDGTDSKVPPLYKHEKPIPRLRSANHNNSNSLRKRRPPTAIVSKATVKRCQEKQKRHVLDSSSKTAQQHIEECLRRKLLFHSSQQDGMFRPRDSTEDVKNSSYDIDDVSPLRIRLDSDGNPVDGGSDDDVNAECFSRHHDSLSLLSAGVSPGGPRRRTKSIGTRQTELPSSWFESTNIGTFTKLCNDDKPMTPYTNSMILSSWIEESDDEERLDTKPNQPIRKGSVRGRQSNAMPNESPIAAPISATTTKISSRFDNPLPTMLSQHQQRGRTMTSPFYDISSPLSVKKPVRQRSWDETLCTDSSESDDEFNFCRRINKSIDIVGDTKSVLDSSTKVENSRYNRNRNSTAKNIDLHQAIQEAADISKIIAERRIRSRALSSQPGDNTELKSRKVLLSSSSSSSSFSSLENNDISKSYQVPTSSMSVSKVSIPTVALIDKILTTTSILDNGIDA